MTDRMHVSGFRTPRSKPKRRRRWVPLVHPRNLLWLAVLAAVPVIAWGWGTPHLLMEYRYEGTATDRFYLDCRYLGLNGRLIHPLDGRCPVVRLLKPAGDS